MDGECVCVGPDGIANFDRLHSRCYDWAAIFYAFDLMERAGEDLRGHALRERKEILRSLLLRHGIYLCRHDESDGEALFAAACRIGLEGIVSKRIDSHTGRARSARRPGSP